MKLLIFAWIDEEKTISKEKLDHVAQIDVCHLP